MKEQKHIAVVGAGLVGSLLSIYLVRRGYQVSIIERRPDMRQQQIDGGRSINLALSNRGLRPLSEVGLADAVKSLVIPMHGRMIHDLQGHQNFLPYGTEGQFINSISRRELNVMLMNEGEKHGVQILFDRRCLHVDLHQTKLTTVDVNGKKSTDAYDLIIGADGAFSAVRSAFQITDRFNYNQFYIDHGYKELQIPPGPGQSFLLEKNALHIWPRDSYMLIALPNPDGNFTCTLFYPFEGPSSFASLTTEKRVRDFFESNFPDALALMPTLIHDFFTNPASSLVTIRCYPWVRNNTLLIGDAAHGIVPFYGQGMNAGFEDTRILNQLLDQHQDDWQVVLPEFQRMRKPDADAIAELALDNFIEMRDLVADPEFILRKKIEARMHQLYPEKWIPLYSMVTFHDEMGYAEALTMGRRQKAIMDEVLRQPHISERWEELDFANIVNRLP